MRFGVNLPNMSALSILDSGEVLATDLLWARSFRARAKGLLTKSPLERGQALVIEPAAQVHTFGLGYPIDVVFCDRSRRVKHIVRRMRPRRVTRWVWRARYAIELPAGSVPVTLEPGHHLTFGFNEGSRPAP